MTGRPPVNRKENLNNIIDKYRATQASVLYANKEGKLDAIHLQPSDNN
jgi:hypothetical protein